jgi:hypothetical protein
MLLPHDLPPDYYSRMVVVYGAAELGGGIS